MYSNSTTIRDLVIPKGKINIDSESSQEVRKEDNGKKCLCIGELIKRIIILRRSASTFDGDYDVIHNNEIKWAKLFMEFILGTAFCEASTCLAHSDDMIWYVRQSQLSSSFYLNPQVTYYNEPQSPSILQVFRRHSKNQPAPSDSSFNWEETVCLNLIMQQLDFFVTCAVCTKTSPQNLQIIKKNCQRVYPSPSRRQMDSKGETEEISYPKLYFAIDGFEEIFNDVVVRDGECVCVELVARDRQRSREAVIFLGSIRYEVLKQVYDTKASSTWHWAQKFMKQSNRRQEFVRMRGPQGKGYAEMAVARVANCGYETPITEHQIDFSDFAIMEQSMNRRRMSETNLAAPIPYRKQVSTPGTQSARGRKWQSEADTVNQCPEVEGNDIDDELDEGVLSRLWSVKGFGQAWHWLREKKRAECTPLNAYLTYVTLPWTSILSDLLSDNPKRPILSFEFDTEPLDFRNRT